MAMYQTLNFSHTDRLNYKVDNYTHNKEKFTFYIIYLVTGFIVRDLQVFCYIYIVKYYTQIRNYHNIMDKNQYYLNIGAEKFKHFDSQKENRHQIRH